VIEGLRPYVEMKASGHPWMAKLPAHWEVRRNGRLFAIRRETGYPDLPILEVSIGSGVRVRDFDNGARKQVIADRSKYQRAVRGDMAYNMMRMWQGAVGVAPVDGLVSPAYVVVRPYEGVDASYFAYLFRTAAYKAEIDSFSRGIVPDRNRLYPDAFKQMPSAYPPTDEQQLIARFLDWHGAMTGQLIRAKKRLISLVNEQKQSINHRAVTRGLDPQVKLKPSGVDWLGDVPEAWEVKRLKRACRVGAGRGTVKGVDPGALVSFLPMERVGADGSVDYAQMVPLSEIGPGFSVFRRDDVIVAKITPCFENGKGALLSAMPTEIGFGSSEFIVLRALAGLLPEFLYLLTSEGQFRRSGVEAMTGSAGQQRVPPEFIGNYVVALPPPETQAEICEFVNRAEF
jgi:type I restriction enzyme S subunit